MDFGMMAGGMAEGLSPLPGLMMEGRKMSQQQAQFEQEVKIKKSALLIDMLKDPNIPNELKESHLYPQFAEIYNGFGGTQLPAMPQGTWSGNWNKVFNNIAKIKDGYKEGKYTLEQTQQMIDAYSSGLIKQEDVKRAEKEKDQFLSQEIMAGRKGYREQQGPVPESGEPLPLMEQKMTSDEQTQMMTRLSKDEREFVEKQRNKVPYVDPDGRTIMLDPDKYIEARDKETNSPWKVYYNAHKDTMNASDIVTSYHKAEAAAKDAGGRPPEYIVRYASYLAECKKLGVTTPDPIHVFEEKYQTRITGAKTRAAEEARGDVKAEQKQKRREQRKGAVNKDQIK